MQPFSVDDKVLLSPWGPARRVLSYDIYVRGRAPALKGEQISEMKGPFVVLRAEMVLDMQGSLQQDKGGREEEGEIVDKEQRVREMVGAGGHEGDRDHEKPAEERKLRNESANTQLEVVDFAFKVARFKDKARLQGGSPHCLKFKFSQVAWI